MTLVEGAVEYMVLNSEGTSIYIQVFPSRKARQLLQSEHSIFPSFSWITGQPPRKSSNQISKWPTYPILHAEHRGEDQDKNHEAEIDHHYSVFQYVWCEIDGEATLYLVQNCERKKEEVLEEKKDAPKEW
jgi:hypothetical protein